MHDLRFVVENLQTHRDGWKRRGLNTSEALTRLEHLAEERSGLIAEVEQGRHTLNEANERMARSDKQSEAFAQQRAVLKDISARNRSIGERLTNVEGEISSMLMTLPNLPSHDTPEGLREEDNPVLRVWGEAPSMPFAVKDHVDIGTALGILDMEGASTISGARFVVLRGAGARLQRALLQMMLDVHADKHGYEEAWVPTLVKDSALHGTGQLPKFADDLFRIDTSIINRDNEGEARELYLSPTAEVPLTNLHTGQIIDAERLPIRYAAYTSCFRSEAGNYGRDTRGMIRVHQFDKVELVRFCDPAHGEQELETITGHAENILQRLGLHHRVVQHCAGELGFSATKAYDLEVWLPSQQRFREISSCSLCGTFQARRAGIRFRPSTQQAGGKKAKPQFVATLNGSALAIGRTVVALLEQGQQADGSVRIPDALQPYMGGLQVIAPHVP